MPKICPMCFNMPPNQATETAYACVNAKCAWWCEETQKCAVLLLAEVQRKAVKSK